MHPGLRLRQARERLGLTYREVERASYELAARRGRSEFILHISRLAEIENRGVVPGLHKFYTLAVIYHLNPREILRWCDVPIDECFTDGTAVPAPQTHLMAPPASLRIPMRFDPAFDPRRTEFLSRMVEKWGHFEGVLTNGDSHHVYSYIGMSDRRMVPLLRPGSIVLVDVAIRKIDDGDWTTDLIALCISSKYAMDTAVDGFTRMVRGSLCSRTRSPAACRKRGACRKRRKSSAA
jgi:transcriptional regulator with XRE-family HTH domain